MRIPVDVRRFPWIRRLAADYAYDFRSVAPFFSGDPADRAAWADAIARTQAHDRRRDEIAAVIAAQQAAPRRAGARASKPARRLADRRTVAVVTGQQAGLFGGPLFTLLKALTALKLAEQVSRDHNVPAVADLLDRRRGSRLGRSPVAVRCSTTTLDAAHASRCRPRPAPTPRRSRPSRLDDSIVDVARRARAAAAADRVPRRRSSPACARAYAPGVGMADAFGRWLEQVLGDRGLVVYDSSDPASKPLAARGVRARALDAGPDREARGARRLRSGRARLPRAGARAGRQPGAVSSRLGRRPPRDPPAGRPVRRRRRSASRRRRSSQQATEQPAGFSPNVLLRPVVQDTLFPTICYVAGPERAGVSRPAARRLRALRRADAADVSARDARRCSIRPRCASSRNTSCRSKRCRRRTKRR